MLTQPIMNKAANEDNKFGITKQAYLPTDPIQAVHTIIRLSRKIIDVAQREGQALAMDDMIGFSAVQDEKEQLSIEYERASTEFHTRLEEFRGVDKALIAQMDKLQREIGEHAEQNNKMIARIVENATHKTQTTLYEAQQIAQNQHVVFPASTAQKTETADSKNATAGSNA